MNKVKACFAFFLFVFVCTFAFADEMPRININAHTEQERITIERAIKDAYPFLSTDQQALIRQGLYFVVHDGILANNDVAFGPEDDPNYRYPDQTLYPMGTIKINLTSSLMKNFLIPIYGNGNPAKNTLERFASIELVAHEIKHAQQYIKYPVNALKEAGDCPNGACDRNKFTDTKIKMRYEYEAMVYGWEVATQATRKEGAHVRFRPTAIPEPFVSFYTTMYTPVVLADDCIEDGILLEDKKKEARYFIKFAQINYLENVYRYLPPVFVKINTCL